MKINLPVRFKNPWFWIGVIATILAAIGISPEMFTSWGLVWEEIKNIVLNPFQLGCVIIAVLGIFVDPTTSGLGDSARALTYNTPYKDIESDILDE